MEKQKKKIPKSETNWNPEGNIVVNDWRGEGSNSRAATNFFRMQRRLLHSHLKGEWIVRRLSLASIYKTIYKENFRIHCFRSQRHDSLG